MRVSNILFTVALAYKFANAKVINFENSNVVIESNDVETINLIENKDFKYKYHCVEDVNGICDTISNELSVALSDLSSTLEIKEPVIFESYALNATQAMPQFASLVAFTTDFNYVTLKTSNDTTIPSYIYPQSLAKQLNLDRELNLKNNDFLIFFNTDNIDKIIKFYPDCDLSTVILHEIIHGLGFFGTGTLNNFDMDASKITTAEQISEYFAGSSYMPNLITGIDSDEIDNAKTMDDINKINYQIDSFTPLSIYQKYLIDLETNEKIFKDLGFVHEGFNKCIETFDQYEDLTKALKDCVSNFDEETRNLLKKISIDYYLKYQSTGFLSNDNSIMPIQTFDNEFSAASSISHNDSKYINTLREMEKNNIEITPEYYEVNEQNAEEVLDENFLMYFHTVMVSREFLLKTVAKNNKHGLIGPKIVSALKTIGWTEKGEKSSDDLYYIDNDNIPEQNNVKLSYKMYLLSQENSIEPPIETTTVENPVETTTVEPPVETTTVEPPVETTTVEIPVETTTAELPVESDSDNEDDIDDLNTVNIEEEIDSAEESN